MPGNACIRKTRGGPEVGPPFFFDRTTRDPFFAVLPVVQSDFRGQGLRDAAFLWNNPEGVIMTRRSAVLMILAAVVCLSSTGWAQLPLAGSGGNGGAELSSIGEANSLNPNQNNLKHWIVAGQVKTLDGTPVAGAKIIIQPTYVGEVRVVNTNRDGEFGTAYDLNVDMVKNFSVTLITNKKGYIKGRAYIDFGSSDKPFGIPITLRTPDQDPDLLSQAEFVSALTPRLTKLGPADGLSAKSEKDYSRGVDEFVVRNHPDRSLDEFNKVVARDPDCVASRTMLALAELQSGDWDGANQSFARGLEDTRKLNNRVAGQTIDLASSPGRGRPEPALALAVMESWRHQLERASEFFSEALSYSPNDPLALQEIGRMELLLRDFPTANAYLSKAIAAGASPEARLLHVEALTQLGYIDEAKKEMSVYLDGRDIKSMPLEVRQAWDQMNNKEKIQATYLKEKPKEKKGIDYLHGSFPELTGMVPAADQAQLKALLDAVGKNVEAYFRNFPNTVSLEQIHQEKVSHKGKREGTLDQKFYYLCLAPTLRNVVGFTEYRTIPSGEGGQPRGLEDGYMLTSGFASANLIFHPMYQPDSNFRLLGRQKIAEHDTYVIAFAQRPERARLNGMFKIGAVTMPTFSQGLAWVDASNYQIIRLRTDLLRPLQEVHLERETTEIDFAENHFKSIDGGFWLPKEVKVSVDWDGRNLTNLHDYSDFKLFNVGASEKLGSPREAKQTSKENDASHPPN